MKIWVYTPSAAGGHAYFTRCLMLGLRHALPDGGLELITSDNLAGEFIGPEYTIRKVLPCLRPRPEFRSHLAWGWDRLWHYLLRDWRFMHMALRERPDVVHLQEWMPEFSGHLVGRLRRSGIAVVMSVHNVQRHEEHFRGHKRYQQWWEIRAWQRANRVVVLSPAVGERVIAAGVDATKVRYVPHWVWPGGSSLSAAEVMRKHAAQRALLFGTIRRNKGG